MILTGWEIIKEDAIYTARERRMGRDGIGVLVDELTGRTMHEDSLENLHAVLLLKHPYMKSSPRLPKSSSGKEILEFWF
jgi:hypothetical protein